VKPGSMNRLLPAFGLAFGLLSGLAPLAFAAPAEKAEKAAPSAPAPAARAVDTALSQSDAGRLLILGVLSRDPEAVKPYLVDSLRSEVTPEVIDALRSQVSWLYDMLGGDFREFMKGNRTFEDGAKAYYREYQMANVSETRAPLLVVQVLFPDSTLPQSVGIQVKSFLGNEKMISGAQTWKIEGRDIDIHSMVLAENAEGKFLAIQIHDPDTAALERERIGRIATPLIREAIARGYLDTAKAANDGVEVQKLVGTVFLRRDPNAGFIHARVAFRPEEYGMGGLEKALAAPADSAAAKPKPAPKAKAKAKKKK
jgi:hypothetical protein